MGVSVFQDGMSLDTGTFSGNQKLPVNRSHTSASFRPAGGSSDRRNTVNQLHSFGHQNPFRAEVGCRLRADVAAGAARANPTLPLGCDNSCNRDILCWRVASRAENLYSDALNLRVAIQYCTSSAPQRPVHPCSSRYQLPATSGVPHRARQFALQFLL